MLEMLESQALSVLIGYLLGSLNEIPDTEVDNLGKTLRNRQLQLPGIQDILTVLDSYL